MGSEEKEEEWVQRGGGVGSEGMRRSGFKGEGGGVCSEGKEEEWVQRGRRRIGFREGGVGSGGSGFRGGGFRGGGVGLDRVEEEEVQRGKVQRRKGISEEEGGKFRGGEGEVEFSFFLLVSSTLVNL